MTDALRIHYCLDKPRDDRRCRARCGHWTTRHTDEPNAVTCAACRKLIGLPPKSDPMNKLSALLPLALLILTAACDTPDDPSGTSTSGASSTSDGPTSEAMEESSTGDSTTGDGSTGDTSGSGGEGMGSGGVEACWADECGEDMPCGKNLACLPHPINGAMVCAASDCDPSAPCEGLTSACPVTVPQGVCILNETKHGWCYPQICVAVGDCAAGSDCVNGYCY